MELYFNEKDIASRYKYIDNYSDHFKRLVCDFKVNGKWVKSKYTNGVQVLTHAYQTWRHMKSRCLRSSKFHEIKPTYSDCEVGSNFEDFQYFAEWYIQQKGYRFSGYQLDKDILCHGNKVYSEENCVLVPAFINGFAAQRVNKASVLGSGIGFIDGKYRAAITNGVGNTFLGSFSTLKGAREVYKTKKCETAKEIVKIVIKHKLPIDERVLDSLNNWEEHFNE